MFEFIGRVAVITGGASGIGLGLASKLASEGMKIVLADIETLSNALLRLEKATRSVRFMMVPLLWIGWSKSKIEV